MASQPLRDRHGFIVPADYEHLARIYAPLHEKEEKERLATWDAFLSGAAAQLGLPPGGSATAAAGAVLPCLLGNGAASPALVGQLSKAVHGGVPRPLRPVVWPLLLHARRAVPEGRYEALLRVVEAPGGAPHGDTARACASWPGGGARPCWRMQLHGAHAHSDLSRGCLAPRTPVALGPPLPKPPELFPPPTDKKSAPARRSQSTHKSHPLLTHTPRPPFPDDIAPDEQAALAAAAGASGEQLLLWRQQGRAWLSQIDKDMSRWVGGPLAQGPSGGRPSWPPHAIHPHMASTPTCHPSPHALPAPTSLHSSLPHVPPPRRPRPGPQYFSWPRAHGRRSQGVPAPSAGRVHPV
jgi:hypothetical protein